MKEDGGNCVILTIFHPIRSKNESGSEIIRRAHPFGLINVTLLFLKRC